MPLAISVICGHYTVYMHIATPTPSLYLCVKAEIEGQYIYNIIFLYFVSHALNRILS